MQKLTIGQVINIALILLVIVFIGQNLDSIAVRFLFFEFKVPIIVIILLCLVLGYVSAIFFGRKGPTNKDQDA